MSRASPGVSFWSRDEVIGQVSEFQAQSPRSQGQAGSDTMIGPSDDQPPS